ncbi:acyl CoA binding protein-domain-containing protein [Coprinopsis sp. MPI-PUGE-AT-0042]|nr:acyl CoA binding protein-domain-containing protein [Coprinopsis sp. MPI-PUGE-AT-0042]
MSEAQFKRAAEIIRSLPKDGPVQPSTNDQLYFYKYFKQGSIGDNETTKPGMFDFAGKAKWEAWTSVKGVSKEEAWKLYVEKFIEILTAAGDEESKKYIAEIEAAA